MSKLSAIRPNVGCVLVVDDEVDILESLQQIFEVNFPGARVLTATGGARALELLQSEPVDLLIADYRMPGMDGLELLARASQAKPAVPRVLITAYPELQVAMRAINEAAISNFLTKPLNTTQLMDVVRAAFVKAKRPLA